MESTVIETRGSGKLGWREQTLASMSAPPSPLIALVGIVILLMYFSSYSSYKAQMHQTKASFNLVLLFLPMILIFLAYHMTKYGRFMSPAMKETVVSAQSGASPWGVSLFLGLMLVLVSISHIFSPSGGRTSISWWFIINQPFESVLLQT